MSYLKSQANWTRAQRCISMPQRQELTDGEERLANYLKRPSWHADYNQGLLAPLQDLGPPTTYKLVPAILGYFQNMNIYQAKPILAKTEAEFATKPELVHDEDKADKAASLLEQASIEDRVGSKVKVKTCYQNAAKLSSGKARLEALYRLIQLLIRRHERTDTLRACDDMDEALKYLEAHGKNHSAHAQPTQLENTIS
jgi:hypothetical protein